MTSVDLPGSTGCDRYFDVRWIDVSAQPSVELVAVELAFPPRHHDRGHAIAGEVHECPAFTHELVNAEKDGHPWHERRIDGRQRCRERNEARTRDAARALRGQEGDQQNGPLLAPGQIEAHSLRDKERGEGHVDV